MITPETPEFGPAVLRSLPALVPAGMTQADLALELGLSAHLQTSAIDVDDAIAQMWAVRQAVLEAADMDASAEPIPFGGRNDRLGLLNMVIYLGNLVERAATLQRLRPPCHRGPGHGPAGHPAGAGDRHPPPAAAHLVAVAGLPSTADSLAVGRPCVRHGLAVNGGRYPR